MAENDGAKITRSSYSTRTSTQSALSAGRTCGVRGTRCVTLMESCFAVLPQSNVSSGRRVSLPPMMVSSQQMSSCSLAAVVLLWGARVVSHRAAIGSGWAPHPAEIVAVPTDGDQIVYGSRFARSSDELVYFLVNPTNRTAHGRITVPRTPQSESTGAAGTLSAAPGIDVASFTFLDCYRGSDVQLEPLVDGSRGNLRVRVEGLGLGKSHRHRVCSLYMERAWRI